MRMIYVRIFLLLNLMTIGQGQFNVSIATKCRRELETDDRKLVELCDVFNFFLACAVNASFSKPPTEAEGKVFEERLKDLEGNSPCTFNLQNITRELRGHSNETGYFSWSKESVCRAKLSGFSGPFDFDTVCLVLDTYWACVIKDAFARKPTTVELKIAEGVFDASSRQMGFQLPCTFDLTAIADRTWSSKHIATLARAQFNASSEARCRNLFWDCVRSEPMNYTCDRIKTYITCVLAESFVNATVQEEERSAFEEVYLPAFEKRAGRLRCQYDLKALSDQARNVTSSGQSSPEYISAGHLVWFILGCTLLTESAFIFL